MKQLEPRYICSFNLDTKIQELWSQKPNVQKAVCIEELSELTKELCKNLRGKDNRQDIIEELADVLIITQSLQLIFNISNIELLHVKEFKEKRTLERIKQNKE